VQRLGQHLFPGALAVYPVALEPGQKRGLIELIPMGPIDHTGPGGYLDEDSRLPDGRTFLDATVETITRLIERDAQRAVRVYPAAD
jgi:hypothetical protein